MFSLIKWFIIGCMLLLLVTACVTYFAVYRQADNLAAAIVSGEIMNVPAVTHTESNYTLSDVLIYGFLIVGVYFVVCIIIGIYRGFWK